MHQLTKRPLLVLATILTGVFTAYPSTIYTNGAPNQADGLDISAFVAADDFTLILPSTLTGVTFYASADQDPFFSQFSGSVGYGIFTDETGIPGSLVTSGVLNNPTLTDTGNQIFGTEEYRVVLSLPALPLAAGTYWLGLHENAFGIPDDGTTIYWDTSSSQAGALPMVTSDLSGSDGWFPGLSETTNDLAFSLDGTSSDGATPEPNLLFPVLLGCAVLILIQVSRRRRRNRLGHPLY